MSHISKETACLGYADLEDLEEGKIYICPISTISAQEVIDTNELTLDSLLPWCSTIETETTTI